jgi:hypothetical protein
MRDQQGWRLFALCSVLTTEQKDKLFFYGPGGSPVRARRFCQNCPVKSQCRDFAILYEEEGIWGGTTDDERQLFRTMMPDYVLLLKKEALEHHNLEVRETVNVLGLRLAQSVVEVLAEAATDQPDYDLDSSLSLGYLEIFERNLQSIEIRYEGYLSEMDDYTTDKSSL